MHRHYVIDHSAVASDIIDGEAIILHHRSGDYFSADGTGAVIWEWLGAEKSREAMLAAFMAGFPASRDTIEESVDAFLADLLDHALILEVGPNAAMANGADHEAAPTDPALTGELARGRGSVWLAGAEASRHQVVPMRCRSMAMRA
jgi:hypothetical protein